MGSKPESYVKEFTRHSTDMMLNLNEMRKREILTDVKVFVDGEEFKAHKAVLIACSGFFYSIFSDQTKRHMSLLTLPCGISAGGFRLLLEFMYTSCLPLDAGSVSEVLTAASYLQMDHVAEACRSFARFSVPHIHTYLKSLDYPLGRTLACFLGTDSGALPFIPSRALVPSRAPRLLTSVAPGDRGYFPESAFRFPDGCVAPRKAAGGKAGWRAGPDPRAGSGDPDPCPEARPPKGGKPPEGKAPAERPGAYCGQKSGKPPILAPDSPMRSDCRPNSPTESQSAVLDCSSSSRRPTPAEKPSAPHPGPDPKACNWKKYKFIVLNSLSQAVKEQGTSGSCSPPTLSCSPEPPYTRNGNPAPGGGSSSSGDESSTNMEEETEDEDSTRNKAASRSSSDSQDSRGYSVCSVCELHFEHNSELCHHILVSHPGEEIPEYHLEFSDSGSENGLFSCSTCDLKLSDEESLQRHFLRVHSDDKPYKCDMCQAAFRYKGNLASHKTVHTGEKPYRCNVCGAQFNRPANLKTHTRIHSGEKPYKCETCGARFVQVAHLRAHVLIHTGEKPYPCETCGTRFRHLQTLKSHIRIHTGEKPYHCEKCDLHFRHKSQLRLHLRQKHGAITNTKMRYKIVPELYMNGLQPC
ncbi:B-cell lymphoma 6 protein homolog [Carcharodon carcharias]|uniref:B-cell lymphoma 6 protein homolog n=1 Tax=Carcharodon carcharias TaxID=13397 RepID=UPI001B7DBB80|nr:B-cell lymphoma 6 protein homolog [Carcharodon carcharias]XP_041034949.1 B-cell lymphoma 6 protein homolog [Carcharodon carcharias]